MSGLGRWVSGSPVLGATLVVMGTCVGAGALSLPVSTALLGFWGTLAVVLLVWWFMYYAGLLVFEVASSFRAEASYLTMARCIFGAWIGRIVFIAFLALLYSLLAAYLVAGADLIKAFLHFVIGDDQPIAPMWGLGFWVGLGFFALWWGMRSVDYINRLCVIALASAIVAMLISLSLKVSVPTLLSHDFHWHYLALPFVMSAFGYQVVVPSIRQYLNGHAQHVCIALFWGTLIPAVIYLTWCSELFAILPKEGPHNLLLWANSAKPAYSLPLFVHHILDHAWFSTVTSVFIFFAIISSFLGILMSLYDLLSDALNMPNAKGGQHLGLIVMALLPSFIYGVFFHDGFMLVMRYASVLVALLNGLLPAIMAIRVRQNIFGRSYRAPGGMPMLFLCIVFFTGILAIALFL